MLCDVGRVLFAVCCLLCVAWCSLFGCCCFVLMVLYAVCSWLRIGRYVLFIVCCVVCCCALLVDVCSLGVV